jgi:hypothetical protein
MRLARACWEYGNRLFYHASVVPLRRSANLLSWTYVMDTWWIDEPRLLGSSNPTNTDLDHLRRDGFSALISLLREEEQSPRYDIIDTTALGFIRHNIPVKDFCPPTVDQLEHFIGLVASLPLGQRAIVHCQGGTGRTGTFAAAYWLANGMTLSNAITFVRQARPHAIETPEQEAVLKDFAARRAGQAEQG